MFVHKTQMLVVAEGTDLQLLQNDMAITEIGSIYSQPFTSSLRSLLESLSSELATSSQSSKRVCAASAEGSTISIIESLSQLRYTPLRRL